MELVSELRKKSEPLYFKTTDVKIDKENGIIKGIVIGQQGFDKAGEYWDEIFLKQLVAQGNAMPQGLKSRFGHPTMCDTTLGSYIGRFKDFTLSKNNTGKQVVTADLYLDPICKDAPGGRGNLFDYVLKMAEKNSDMFGNSIAFYQNESEKVDVDFGGETKSVFAIRLKMFDSSDLVDSPCAADTLFKDTDDLGIITTTFLEQNPKVFEFLSTVKGKEIVDNFLIKLKNHQSNKMKDTKEKSLLQQFKEIFGSKNKAFEMETSTGEMLTVSDEDGDGKAGSGDKVTAPDGSPKASATITAKDGSTITTDADGKITEVKEGTAAAAAPTTESTKEFADMKAEIKAMKDQRELDMKEFKEGLELAKSEKEKSDKEAATLKEQLSKLQGKHEVVPGKSNVGEAGKPSEKEKSNNRVEEAFAKKSDEEKK